MNKQELIRDMKKEVGSFPNTSQIARYLRTSREKSRNLVAGLEHIGESGAKKYFVNDVADRIMQQRTTG